MPPRGGRAAAVRVIAGAAKGRVLVSPRTPQTRPITDRAKESLFNILGPRVPGARFLDLFAGSGSVGVEALSRGCAHATFVERSPRALDCLRRNLDLTGLADRAEVVAKDVFSYLRQPPPPEAFDVVFVAPPQWRGLWARALAALDEAGGWLADDGAVVAQHDPAEAGQPPLRRLRVSGERTYGRVRFTFFRPDAQRPR